MKVIDSIRPPQRPEKLARPVLVQQGTGARFTKLVSTPRRRIAWGIVGTLAASPLLLLLAALGWIGIAVITVAGVVALVYRVPSRMIFLMTLMAFVYMLALQLSDNGAIAQSMAVLAYILLAVGVISLAKEVKISSRLWFKKH